LPDNLPPFPGNPVLPFRELFIAFKKLRQLKVIHASREPRLQTRQKFAQVIDFKTEPPIPPYRNPLFLNGFLACRDISPL
jgi:hypothetical protein